MIFRSNVLMKMLVLMDRGKSNFQGLLDLCFERSSYFSLTSHTPYEKEAIYTALLNELNPFYIKAFDTNRWFCYFTLGGTIERLLFSTNLQTKVILQRYFDRLFLDKTTHHSGLEDLCFFYGNKLLLGTVSHEHICHVYPPDDLICQKFKQLGDWEEVAYSPDEHITIEI